MKSISDFTDGGGFASKVPPVKADATWKRGEDEISFSFFVRKIGVGERERIFKKSVDDRSEWAANIAAKAVLDSGERFTYEQAYDLEEGLALAMMVAIKAADGEGKNSQPPTSSGTT